MVLYILPYNITHILRSFENKNYKERKKTEILKNLNPKIKKETKGHPND